jgi:hypothetical protein
LFSCDQSESPHSKNSELVPAAIADEAGGESRANPEPSAKEIAGKNHYSPDVGNPHPTRVYWGDTHLHTRLSQDAFTFGVTLGPDEAYKFAMGEPVKATHGEIAQLARPLDFLVVSDHAEGLGAMQALMGGDERLLESERLRGWRDGLINSKNSADRQKVAMDGINNGWPEALETVSVKSDAWQHLRETAERYYQPGKFTSFIGFEWTSWPGGSNLHRVVVFRDGAEKTGKVIPFSQNESDKPQDLWKYLENYENNTGGQVMAIPHNGNLSNGLLYPVLRENGDPLGADYVNGSARWESIAEVTQIKGDGETHAFLSPNDEFADYETWDKGNFHGVPKTNEMLEFEYLRSALKNGLKLESEYGTNPFKYGMIGSTDSHTALATADEDNFFGKHSAGMEPNRDRWEKPVGKVDTQVIEGFRMAASGYAGVWAKENTRESIWDAMKRKEVYATTGPRMTVRMFGGWDFEDQDAHSANLAKIGYAGGVPMGGDLSASNGDAPRFLIAAAKDPLGANLDRVQMVKGWLGDDGTTHEQVFEVTWAGDRSLTQDGKLPAIGSTVDTDAATYTNSIGTSELTSVWSDPSFDKSQHAFYYLRVLEIPTPRWTAYDRKHFKSKMTETVVMEHQDRAYTSPIWYTP